MKDLAESVCFIAICLAVGFQKEASVCARSEMDPSRLAEVIRSRRHAAEKTRRNRFGHGECFPSRKSAVCASLPKTRSIQVFRITKEENHGKALQAWHRLVNWITAWRDFDRFCETVFWGAARRAGEVHSMNLRGATRVFIEGRPNS